ncbi:MAG: YfhO family protein [Anaerolineae bacterium]
MSLQHREERAVLPRLARHRGAGSLVWTELLGAAALLLASILIFLWPAVWGGRVLLPADLLFEVDSLWRPMAPEGFLRPGNHLLSDQVLQFAPWEAFARRALSEGNLPLWNPYTNGGVPFLGNAQSAMLSPFRLIGYLFPYQASFVVTAVLRLLIAGIFTYSFARAVGMGQPGALLSMIAFTYAGPLIAWLGHPHSFVLAWLPAMLWATERALATGRLGYAGLSAFFIGAQFLGGHPETSFHVLLAWLAYGLYRVLSRARTARNNLWPGLARLLGSLGVGCTLSAVQLLPVIESIYHSTALGQRTASGLPLGAGFFEHALLDWHDWPTLVTALLPQFYGSPVDQSYFYPWSNYIEQNLYVGIVPLALAGIAVWYAMRRTPHSRRGIVVFFAVMAGISLGVALRLPVLTLVGDLPLFRLAANGRLRMIYAFSLAILAGFGLDRLEKDPRARRAALYALVAIAILSVVLIAAEHAAFVLFEKQIVASGRAFFEAQQGTPAYPLSLAYYYAQVETRYQQKLSLASPTNAAMYLPVLAAGIWTALYRLQRGPFSRLWTGCVLALVFLDAFLTWSHFHPAVPSDQVYPEPPAVRFLEQDPGLYRVAGLGATLSPNTGMLFALSDIRGYETLVPERYDALFDRIAGSYRHHFHALLASADSPLLDLLNVRYVIADRPLGGRWELAYTQGGVYVYRNPGVLSRAFVVYDAVVVAGAQASLERVAEGELDWRSVVVLEERPAGWQPPAQAPASQPTVDLAHYGPDRISLQVETAAQGLLVLTDTYAPGWTARVDGRPTPVYVADHAFRAVVVPQGTHAILFRYDPLSFRIGAALSGLTASALLTLAAALVIRRVRRSAA